MDVISLVIWIIGFTAGISVLILAFAYVYKFKHKVRIKRLTGSKKVITDDKAKEFTDKDGVTYWKLLKLRKIIPIPPADAIEITSKGKFSVEAYLTETGEITYITDKTKHGDIKDLEPLTTKQRILLINQIKKANERFKPAWENYVPIIASGLTLIIILVMVMMFWSDITEPSLQAMGKAEKILETEAQIIESLNQIIQQNQIITGDVSLTNITIPD